MAERQDETAETFGERMFTTVQSGFTAVSIAVGSATGLFNTMATLGEAKTSQEIADAAGLKERYVREWLGAMVVAGIVDVDSDKDTYYLPPHRHNALCTKDGAGDTAVLAEGVPMLCEVYKDVADCFRKDGPNGVPESTYTLFDPWMDGSATRKLKGESPKFAKKEEMRRVLESPSIVCDVGCGSGAALCLLARDFPKCEFHGIDISEEAVSAAKSRAVALQLPNVTFHFADAIEVAGLEAWTSKFDLVYCVDVVHDAGRPDLLLQGVRKLVKDGGYFVMNDVGVHTKQADNIGNAWGPYIYTVSLFRCMAVSLSHGDDSFGLGAAWGEEKAAEMLKESGFDCFHIEKTDAINANFFCKKLM